MRLIDAAEVHANLTYELCIPVVRKAMIAFSAGETLQLLRSILPMADGRMFGVMPGALGARAAFGAKVLSVFPGNFDRGVPSHQGVVLLFDAEIGRAWPASATRAKSPPSAPPRRARGPPRRSPARPPRGARSWAMASRPPPTPAPSPASENW